MLNGGDEENRTPDPLLARQVLSQLSYAPIYLLVILSQYFVVSSSPSVDVRFMYISVRFVVTPRPAPKFLRNTPCNYACQQNNCASYFVAVLYYAFTLRPAPKSLRNILCNSAYWQNNCTYLLKKLFGVPSKLDNAMPNDPTWI